MFTRSYHLHPHPRTIPNSTVAEHPQSDAENISSVTRTPQEPPVVTVPDRNPPCLCCGIQMNRLLGLVDRLVRALLERSGSNAPNVEERMGNSIALPATTQSTKAKLRKQHLANGPMRYAKRASTQRLALGNIRGWHTQW